MNAKQQASANRSTNLGRLDGSAKSIPPGEKIAKVTVLHRGQKVTELNFSPPRTVPEPKGE